jgi:hypothetical protein
VDPNCLGVLGVDIGGVVVELSGYQEEDLALGMRIPGEIAGVRTALRRLRDERFGEFRRKRIEKAAVSEELKSTHSVDDRLEVLSYLESVPHRYLFCPDPEEVRRFEATLSLVDVVHDWTSLTRALLAS